MSPVSAVRLIAALALGAGVLAFAGCGGTTTVVPAGAPTTDEAPATEPAPPRTSLPGAPATTDAATDEASTTAPSGTASGGAATAPSGDAPLIRRPAGFPNGGEKYLLARLHPDVVPYCTREPTRSRAGGSVAGLYCATAQRFGVDAYYDLFPNHAQLEASYGRYRRANDIPLNSGDCVPGPGVRASSIPAEGTWGYAGAGRRPEGRVMCFTADGDVWLVTGHERIRTLSFFSAPRRRQVNDFWYGAGFPTVDPR